MARFSHLGNFYSIKAASEQYFSEDTSRIIIKLVVTKILTDGSILWNPELMRMVQWLPIQML